VTTGVVGAASPVHTMNPGMTTLSARTVGLTVIDAVAVSVTRPNATEAGETEVLAVAVSVMASGIAIGTGTTASTADALLDNNCGEETGTGLAICDAVRKLVTNPPAAGEMEIVVAALTDLEIPAAVAKGIGLARPYP
jgi:hypothetical protein